jgi:hypothetical protein
MKASSAIESANAGEKKSLKNAPQIAAPPWGSEIFWLEALDLFI